MNARRMRLFLRDLAALAAFACLAVSDQLPTWSLVLFGVGAGAALLGFRLLRGNLGLLLLGLAGVALVVRIFTGSLDVVIGASLFAALLTLQRLHSEPAQDVDAHVHLTGLLMTAGGAALSADLRFLPALVLYAVCALLSSALGVLERSAQETGEPIPFRPALPLLSLGVLGTLVGACLFFVFIPRLSWNVAARPPTPAAQGTQGFAGDIQLGSGALKTDPRPVIRIHLTPDPGRSELTRYWPGRALDTFDGRRWTAAPGAQRDAPRLRVDVQRVHRQKTVDQELELLPAYGNPTLVGLETPLAFWGSRRLVRVVDEQVRLDGPAAAITYHVSSNPSVATTLTHEQLDRFRTLPPSLDPRVAALAERVTGKETDPERAAIQLVSYLQREYRYSLEAGPATRDPLAAFLFERRSGYCEHFATALAILLRTRGFATRVMTGFYGGERLEDGYVLRAADAHAWVQVYVPGRGFVTYDATPDAFRAGQPSRVLAWLAQRYEQLDHFWRTQLVDYAFADQARSLQWAGSRFRTGSGPATAPGTTGPSTFWKRAQRFLEFVLWAAGGVGLLVWAWRRTRPSPDEAIRLGCRLQRRLTQAPLPIARDEALEDYLLRLQRSPRGQAEAAVPRVLRRYLEARFGARPLEPGEAQTLERLLTGALKRPPPPTAASDSRGGSRA